jgi:hypothetical protein
MKRDTRAERRAAAQYADKVMNGKPAEGWALVWDLVYRAYLAGLRATAPQTGGEP